MNVHDDMSDNEVLSAASESLSAMPMANRPEVEAIMARARAHRRRRLSGAAGLSAAAVAVALGLSLSVTLGVKSGSTAGTIRTAAFVLTHNANGTDTLTLSMGQVLNPATLQQALTQDGIPALVKINTDCTSSPLPGRLRSFVSLRLPDGAPLPMPHMHKPVPADAVIVINPSAMPSGTEIFAGFAGSATPGTPVHPITYHLIDTSSYTCTSISQPAGSSGEPAGSSGQQSGGPKGS